MKILILGHGRHGKDTVAEMISKHYGLSFNSSSMACAGIFIYNRLKHVYGYGSFEECYEDRSNHRAEWHDMICEYNKDDGARLAKEMVQINDMYVGMRSGREINACKDQKIFDLIIGVYDYRKPLEPEDSFDINIWEYSDFVIPNAEGLEELDVKIVKLASLFGGEIYLQ